MYVYVKVSSSHFCKLIYCRPHRPHQPIRKLIPARPTSTTSAQNIFIWSGKC